MSLAKQFKMSKDKEEKGVLIQYGANDDGTIPGFRVLRRASSNQRYTKTLARESAPYRRLIELNSLDEKVSERVFMRVFCLSVLIGWENVQDESNVLISYSFDAAMKLFQELPELYNDLVAQASNAALWRQETVEGDSKNS